MRKARGVLELNQPPARLAKTTPQETKTLLSALLTYEDGTTELLTVIDDQGIHRVSEYSGQKTMIIHEILITYGEANAGPNVKNQDD